MSTAGHRGQLPKNYRLIAEIVNGVSPGAHLRATDVYIEAKRRQPGIGFATVHRGLARLSELGLIAQIAVAGSEAVWYEPPTKPHAHFRCTACGRIDDLDYALPKTVRARLAAQSGLQIDDESLTLSGRCADCRGTAPHADAADRTAARAAR